MAFVLGFKICFCLLACSANEVIKKPCLFSTAMYILRERVDHISYIFFSIKHTHTHLEYSRKTSSRKKALNTGWIAIDYIYTNMNLQCSRSQGGYVLDTGFVTADQACTGGRKPLKEHWFGNRVCCHMLTASNTFIILMKRTIISITA